MWRKHRTLERLGVLISLMALQIVVSGLKVRVFCLSEDLQLKCPETTALAIRMTSVSLLPVDTKLCQNRSNLSAVSCDMMNYSKTLKMSCNGKSNCTIKNEQNGHKRIECTQVFILSVLYDCEKMRPNTTMNMKTQPTRIPTTGKNLSFASPSTATRLPSVVDTHDGSGKKLHAMTYSFFTLLSAKMALKFVQGRPKHVILCIVLSVSAGIVLLIVVILLMVCVERFMEERKKEEPNQMEISLPLLVSPGSQPTTAAPIASAPPSEADSSHVEATSPRLPTIRRSHSVDEGTQTEAGLEVTVDEHGISDNEARELGYLVDIMKYYNSNLDTMSAVDGNLTDKSGTPNTRPRFAGTSRNRQARLSSTTYSSSNNSIFGENHVEKTNHVNCVPLSSHNKPSPRYNSFGHKSHTLGHYNSMNLENGGRRTAARTRTGYPSTASDRVSIRPYGTLS